MSARERFDVVDGIAPPISNAYAHAIAAGGTLYVSGQVGIDPSGDLAGDFEAQARRAFENLRFVLDAAGASMTDLVKMNIMLVDINDLATFRELRHEYLPIPPASTLHVVQSLASPKFLIE